ncbi:MAG: deoxyribonuclease IV [Bacteroidetes bacterium]|nr:deoxyribonuclease IV [Bacteroidota bacterium]
MLLGVHCSVSGGLHTAFEEAEKLGIDTFQMFTRNQRQWTPKPLSADEINDFRTAFGKSKVKIIFSHASYLVNLATSDPKLRHLSVENMTSEVERCHQLGLAFTVVHPGALKGQSEEEGISRIADAVKEILSATPGSSVKILFETTAGQGTSVGWKFEHLRAMLDKTGTTRCGVCFDTCHAFAAGYDIRTRSIFDDTITKFDKIIGLSNLHAVHLNDSKGDFASRKDRHEHIGKGKIGKDAFRYVMNTFINLPKVLETPKDENWDEVNLGALRGLLKR